MALSSRTAGQARRFVLLPFGAPPHGQSPLGTPPHPWDLLVRQAQIRPLPRPSRPCSPIRIKCPGRWAGAFHSLVDGKGLEPSTSALRTRRSPKLS